MVKSKLDDSIVYTENKKLDIDDINYDATLYEIGLMGHKILIALGKPKYTYIDKNIEYYPIYLLKKNRVISQIGIYEIMSNTLPDLLDADGDINLEYTYDPLLYSFVNVDIIKKESLGLLNKEEMGEEETDEEEKVEEESEEEDSDNDIEALTFNELPEQTKLDGEKEQLEYTEKEEAEWIQKFMRSNYYDIVDNEGGGDCFFATVRDGLARAGIKVSVEQLRNKLSEEVDEDTFTQYYTLYTGFTNELDSIKHRIRELANENKELKKQLDTAKEKKEQIAIIERAKNVKKTYNELEQSKKINENLLSEFKFMKGVDTLDKFSDIIKTCEFWGDTWAVSTIERLLNIKLILLSEEAYNSGDVENVLNCGQLNDIVLQSRGVFEPKVYIMLNYTGNHYKLITYKSRGALKFKELPYNVKDLIVNKCLEKNAGPYYIIPDFLQLKGELEIPPEIPEMIEMPSEDLWNDETIFQYYIRSNPKPLPGKGSGEKIGPEGVKAYSGLSSIPEWRRKLDDLWEAPFELNEHKWLSVEHYYQGSKFKNSAPQYYLQFSLDSDSEISKSPSMAKAAGGKSGKFEGKQLRPKNIVIDADFFVNRNKNTLKDALRAKFNQNEELKKMLQLTRKAKLTHYLQGTPATTSNDLMEIRYELNKA